MTIKKSLKQLNAPLHTLAAVQLILEERSISKAAGENENSQSNFSNQLRALEISLGGRLLDRGRGRRDATLTPMGEKLIKILWHLTQGLSGLREQQDRVVIAAGETLVEWLLVPRLGECIRDNLAVELRTLENDEDLPGVLSSSADFGVVTELEPSLHSVALGKVSYHLFVPAKVPGADWREVLEKYPVAVLNGNPTIQKELESQAKKRKFSLRVRFIGSSYPQVAAAVRHLGLPAVLPSLASSYFQRDEVRQLPLPFLAGFARTISLAWDLEAKEIRPSLEELSSKLTKVLKLS